MIYKFEDYKKVEIKRNNLNLGQTREDGASFQVNSRYIEKDGRPWIGVMGEYHYVRDSRENWEEELRKMKAGGINTVASYVFWIYHEEIEGEYDFTGDRNLREFVELCQKLGLSFVLRIGPWCHGEVRNGGFPDWLLKKGCKLRDNDPEYLSLVEVWYRKIFEQVEGLFFKDGGPIMGIQIENELTDNAEHLGELKKIALRIGFDAPIWTVTGWNSIYGAKFPLKEFLPVFGAYVDAPWLDHTDTLPPSKHYTFDTCRNDAAIGMDLIKDVDDDGWRLPYEDYPFATCELGSGLPASYIRRPFVSPMDAYALSLVKLGCGNNLVGYYMYHGGTNKIGKLSTLHESKATGYPNDYAILNYDFQTCIGEYGQIRDQYKLLNLIHLFLNDFGDILAPMEHVPAEQFVNADDDADLRYCMRTDGESGFVFVNHHQRGMILKDVVDASIDTGKVTFPSMNFTGQVACILPFNIRVGDRLLDYATAQLLCQDGSTFYFAAVPGNAPKYSIDGIVYEVDMTADDTELKVGDISIITLSWERALDLRKVDGEIYFDDAVMTVSEYVLEDIDTPFALSYPEMFALGNGSRNITYKKIIAQSPEGLVEIKEKYDVAHLYVDGKLVADSFYIGVPWQVSASLIYGRDVYIVYSDYDDVNVYRDYDNC
ncbi:beta-galactosidase [Pseudobutyrivibrio ruminis]|nr:beta-galactosidase [Pseudobutyrivibrio ruminis]